MNPNSKEYLRTLPAIRWEILRTVKVGGLLGASESMMLATLRAGFLFADCTLVREQMNYLEERGLLKVTRSEVDGWVATLSRAGTDLIEYRIDCEPGIARPALRADAFDAPA